MPTLDITDRDAVHRPIRAIRGPTPSSTPRRTPPSTRARRTSRWPYAVNADAVGHIADGRDGGRRPPRPRQHRLRLRRHARPPVSRGRRDEPAIGVRAVTKLAGERAGRSGRGSRAHVVGLRRTRQQHGQARAAARRRRTPTWPSSTTNAAARRSPPTSPRRCADRRSIGGAGVIHLTNAGRRELVRVRAGDPARPRATTRSRWSGRSRPPSSIRRVRRPARPTACSTTRGGGRPA